MYEPCLNASRSNSLLIIAYPTFASAAVLSVTLHFCRPNVSTSDVQTSNCSRPNVRSVSPKRSSQKNLSPKRLSPKRFVAQTTVHLPQTHTLNRAATRNIKGAFVFRATLKEKRVCHRSKSASATCIHQRDCRCSGIR